MCEPIGHKQLQSSMRGEFTYTILQTLDVTSSSLLLPFCARPADPPILSFLSLDVNAAFLSTQLPLTGSLAITVTILCPL